MSIRAPDRLRTAALRGLAVLYFAAGVLHLTLARPFISITPAWVPEPAKVIHLTGIAELAGALGLVQPWSRSLRRAAGMALALYALCVWPANVNHMLIDLAKPDHGVGLGYHIPRLAAQPLLIWLALWASGSVEWPWRRAAT